MNKIIFSTLAAALLASCTSAKTVDSQSESRRANAPNNVSKAEAPMLDIKLLYAQPFTVEQPFRHDWHSKPQEYKGGTLIVLEADKDFVMARNSLEPILYAGKKTVQRLNRGLSGRVIGIIPGEQDLKDVPIWFGDPELPERVTDDGIKKQFRKASAAGLRNMSANEINDVTTESVEAKNLSLYLREYGADVVLEYAPDEESLAKAWRIPTNRSVKQ